jgi:hypothetical protein
MHQLRSLYSNRRVCREKASQRSRCKSGPRGCRYILVATREVARVTKPSKLRGQMPAVPGGSASVRAATRMKPEQASKGVTRAPSLLTEDEGRRGWPDAPTCDGRPARRGMGSWNPVQDIQPGSRQSPHLRSPNAEIIVTGGWDSNLEVPTCPALSCDVFSRVSGHRNATAIHKRARRRSAVYSCRISTSMDSWRSSSATLGNAPVSGIANRRPRRLTASWDARILVSTTDVWESDIMVLDGVR